MKPSPGWRLFLFAFSAMWMVFGFKSSDPFLSFACLLVGVSLVLPLLSHEEDEVDE